MTNNPDVSELERRIEFEDVSIEEVEESQKNDGSFWNLNISYRENRGYYLSQIRTIDGEEALIHLVRSYVSPKQKELSGRVCFGALPPKDWQPPLKKKTLDLPKKITSVGVGQDYWSLSGILEKNNGDIILDTGNEKIKLVTKTAEAHKYLEFLFDKHTGKHPYNRVSVTTEERPSGFIEKMLVREIHGRNKEGSIFYAPFP